MVHWVMVHVIAWMVFLMMGHQLIVGFATIVVILVVIRMFVSLVMLVESW